MFPLTVIFTADLVQDLGIGCFKPQEHPMGDLTLSTTIEVLEFNTVTVLEFRQKMLSEFKINSSNKLNYVKFTCK